MYDINKLYFGRIAVLKEFSVDLDIMKTEGNEIGIFTINRAKTVGKNIADNKKKYTVYKKPNSMISSIIMTKKIGKKVVVDIQPLTEVLDYYKIKHNINLLKPVNVIVLKSLIQEKLNSKNVETEEDLNVDM